MAARLYWFTDPGIIGQKVSTSINELNGKVGDMLEEKAQEAERNMQEAVMTRGVLWGQPTGGPRAKSFDMYNSIGYEAGGGKEGRASASFGFIKGAPFYTLFQEKGTSSTGWGGPIAPMHAFADAQVKFVDAIEDGLQGINVWENF